MPRHRAHQPVVGDDVRLEAGILAHGADQLLDLLHRAGGGLVGDPDVVGGGVGDDAVVLDHLAPQLLGAVGLALLIVGVDDAGEELEGRRRRLPLEEVERGVGAGGDAEGLGVDALRGVVARDGGVRREEGGDEAHEAVAAEERGQERVEVRGGWVPDGGEERGGAVGEAHRGEGGDRRDGVGRQVRREGGVDVGEAAARARLRRWPIETGSSAADPAPAPPATVERRRRAEAEKTAAVAMAGNRIDLWFGTRV